MSLVLVTLAARFRLRPALAGVQPAAGAPVRATAHRQALLLPIGAYAAYYGLYERRLGSATIEDADAVIDRVTGWSGSIQG